MLKTLLLLCVILAACSELEKRPPNNYNVGVYAVKIGSLKEADIWVKECKIYLASLAKINGRYVEIIIVPPVPNNWTGIAEKGWSFI